MLPVRRQHLASCHVRLTCGVCQADLPNRELDEQAMVAASMWSTRRQAERALNEGLKPIAALLDETFSVLDDCIARLGRLNQPFGRVCALVLIKACNLGLGCYSLSLDALA